MNDQRIKLSEKFIVAYKTYPDFRWKLARKAGIQPTTLSKLVSGAEPVRLGDSRILAVAFLLNLDPKDCFQEALDFER